MSNIELLQEVAKRPWVLLFIIIVWPSLLISVAWYFNALFEAERDQKTYEALVPMRDRILEQFSRSTTAFELCVRQLAPPMPLEKR